METFRNECPRPQSDGIAANARGDTRRGADRGSNESFVVEMSGRSVAGREEVLVAAAWAVLSAFRAPLEQKKLPAMETAALRLLEVALKPYGSVFDLDD